MAMRPFGMAPGGDSYGSRAHGHAPLKVGNKKNFPEGMFRIFFETTLFLRKRVGHLRLLKNYWYMT